MPVTGKKRARRQEKDPKAVDQQPVCIVVGSGNRRTVESMVSKLPVEFLKQGKDWGQRLAQAASAGRRLIVVTDLSSRSKLRVTLGAATNDLAWLDSAEVVSSKWVDGSAAAGALPATEPHLHLQPAKAAAQPAPVAQPPAKRRQQTLLSFSKTTPAPSSANPASLPSRRVSTAASTATEGERPGHLLQMAMEGPGAVQDAAGPLGAVGSWQRVGGALAGGGTCYYCVTDDAFSWEATRFTLFDVDGTLIAPTKTGAKFCEDVDDWKLLWGAATVDRVKEASGAGSAVVLVTNQLGIAKGRARLDKVQGRLLALCARLGVPALVLVAADDDYFRKPRLGMLHALLALRASACARAAEGQHQPESGAAVAGAGEGRAASPAGGDGANATAPAGVRLSECLFVGDAAGRPKFRRPDGKVKADFSASDAGFAFNAGMPFQSPEQFFLGSSLTAHRPLDLSRHVEGSKVAFVPHLDIADPGPPEFLPPTGAQVPAGLGVGSRQSAPRVARPPPGLLPPQPRCELLVLHGPPGCGKSSLARQVFVNGAAPALGHVYVRINQDTLGTRARCLQAAEACLRRGDAVVVDATNRDRAARSQWIALAERVGVPARCATLTRSKDQVFHQLALRLSRPPPEAQGAAVDEAEGPRFHDKHKVPTMVVHAFFKQAQAPTVAEGFEAVVEVPFRATPTSSAAAGSAWAAYEQSLLFSFTKG